MDNIGTEKRAVFLVVPDEKTTYHFLAALFISQCYESLLENAEQNNGKLPVRVNFIMEEFCNMPRLSDLGPMLFNRTLRARRHFPQYPRKRSWPCDCEELHGASGGKLPDRDRRGSV